VSPLSQSPAAPTLSQNGQGANQREVAATQELTMVKAINLALRHAMEQDQKVLVMGEDVGQLGGVFRVTDTLQATFGPDRVRDTPLAESGIVGTAIGLAMRGYKPVCEIQFDGFVYPAFDQITSQLAKLHARSGGQIELPVLIRLPYGGGIGAVEHHSESPEALFAHTAGLRVVTPATPQDAYTMVRAGIDHPDPVILLEPKGRYWQRDPVDTTRLDPAVLTSARLARPGQHVTVAAYGPTVQTALEAARQAAVQGVELEVWDLRAISPLDFDALEVSVKATGRLIIAHEAPVYFGAGAEIAARLTERCFYHLQAPPLRVGGAHLPYPPALVEAEYLPSPDRLLQAVHQAMAY